METRKRFSYGKIYVAYGFLMSLIGNGNFATALSITVTDLECVSEQVLYEGDTISGNFVAIDHDIFWSSDHPGIDFTAMTPAGTTVFSLKGTSGDKFEFKAPQSGIYKFCFRNPVSTPETVSFYIHVGHIPNEHDLAKDEHMDPLNIKIAELREALESITTEQKYLKARDARHRYTNVSTKKRVIYFTLAEYIVFAAASALQVVYIRNLFSKTVGYNRV
ncbi:transmembrane emp24 domain-containing protein p24beta3-like [Prunus yedoensis var. nudiflora]|uniref:Transmembrane emp24 domain-containing protein p24beta3-like n=1 Tax=Prunus yedoensis var. nudiflora TaxID=2094558 RepID=A0A314UU10_PRUYE|nr:transmembrane emp24 domain-containing protein p24beta3-like [Prunus yedoensis var. nudiflora]